MKTLAAYLLVASAVLGAGLQLPTARSGRSTALENVLRTPGTVAAFHLEPVGRLAGTDGGTVEISALKIFNRVNETSTVGAHLVLNAQVQAFIDVTEFEPLQGLLRDLPLYEKSAPTTMATPAALSRVVSRGGLFIDVEGSGSTTGALVLSLEKDDGSVVTARFAPGAYEQFTELIETAKTTAQRML